jgi:hypothetical protein
MQLSLPTASSQQQTSSILLSIPSTWDFSLNLNPLEPAMIVRQDEEQPNYAGDYAGKGRDPCKNSEKP